MQSGSIFEMDKLTRSQRAELLRQAWNSGLSVYLCRETGALGYETHAVAASKVDDIPVWLEFLKLIVLRAHALTFIMHGADDGTDVATLRRGIF